ncbi:UNVERIFIED_CONTAM: hypothetical protein FKN15_031492 [Acipenser sinensis]
MGPGLSRASPSLSPSLVLSDSDAGREEDSRNRSSCSDLVQCRPGILLPVWEPESPSLGDKVARSLVYFVALVYMFLGVSIIADRFMASIEVITSQVIRILKDLKLKHPDRDLEQLVETANYQALVQQQKSRAFYRIQATRMMIGAGNVIRILKDLKLKHPDRDLEQLVETANYQALVQQQKSRAFYRIQATRMMIGAGNVLKKHAADQHRRGTDLEGPGGVPGADEGGPDTPPCSLISFECPHYQCVENCGRLALTVVCHGGEGINTFYVDYRTEDGSARAGSDYEYREGTLVFKPGEERKEIQPPRARLAEPLLATVTILDDDHGGIFGFALRGAARVPESAGALEVTVQRSSGARGTVILPFHTQDGTAKGGGVDYEDARGELVFSNDETL